jgi:hypothetical protein
MLFLKHNSSSTQFKSEVSGGREFHFGPTDYLVVKLECIKDLEAYLRTMAWYYYCVIHGSPRKNHSSARLVLLLSALASHYL